VLYWRVRNECKENLPEPGDTLFHKFRLKAGYVEAKFVSVDRKLMNITVRVNDKEYSSLSAQSKSVAGAAQNGWTYRGLKKQVPYKGNQ